MCKYIQHEFHTNKILFLPIHYRKDINKVFKFLDSIQNPHSTSGWNGKHHHSNKNAKNCTWTLVIEDLKGMSTFILTGVKKWFLLNIGHITISETAIRFRASYKTEEIKCKILKGDWLLVNHISAPGVISTKSCEWDTKCFYKTINSQSMATTEILPIICKCRWFT